MLRDFQIQWPDGEVRELRGRLAATRWTDAVTRDWSYGTEAGFLEALVAHWSDGYEWVGRLHALNAQPHRMATIDGCDIHFLHHRADRGDAIPLLLMNGWPSSFVEFERIVPLLTHGTPSYDLVIPSAPGFGYSSRPTRPYEFDPVHLMPKLMTLLGYERFALAGTDIGAGIATRIALQAPHRVISVHVSSVAEKPASAGDRRSDAELAYEQQKRDWSQDEGGYQAIQNSRPQTLAFALADSPAGMAAWIVEKFRAWSDCGGDVLSVWPMDVLIDNLMIYWMSGTIGSSIRYYFDATRLRPPLRHDDYVDRPTGVAIWPADLAHPPRELAERLYDVRHYTEFARGGHFPAWEAPKAYAEDLRRLSLEPGASRGAAG